MAKEERIWYIDFLHFIIIWGLMTFVLIMLLWCILIVNLRLHLVYGSSVKGEETIKKTMAENEKIERGMKYGAGT